MTLSKKQLLDFDLRSAAFHELGHAIVARRWGNSMITVTVFKILRPKDPAEHRLVTGQTHQPAAPTKMERSANGWAGTIAEHLSREFDVDPDDLFDAISFDLLSETDRRGIEAVAPGRRRRSFMLAYNLVRSEWKTITRLARRLVVAAPAGRFIAVNWRPAEAKWRIVK